MPAAGGVWTALGLWRGVMEVSVVGIGSVNLPNNNKKKSILVFVLTMAQTEPRNSLIMTGY